jgi:hypothetical protein
MTEDDIFQQTNGAYLSLIHPVLQGNVYREDIAPIITLAPKVPDRLVTSMIVGVSWRERLIGFCMAMTTKPETFIQAVLQSLKDPRGIAIVPACAMLAVLARQGAFTMSQSFADTFDRAAFDGEIGWAVDKAMHFAGLREEDVPGRGPNYGQVFENHVEVYSWIRSE